MGSLSEEEFRFFDAADDIASTSSDARSEGAPNSPHYDLWVDVPKSVEERRNSFLKWMEVGSSGPNANPGEFMEGGGVNRVMESSGAVLRNACFEGDLCSRRSLRLNWSYDGSREEFVGRDGNSGGEMTTANVGDSFQHKRIRESRRRLYSCPVSAWESSNVSGSSSPSIQQQLNKTGKRRWLSRLRSMACVVDGRTNAERLDHAVDDSLLYRVCRVKVRQSGKRIKELSALYSGQDIQAHRGSILAMKFSPDGHYLASAGEDGIVRVWQVLEDDRSIERDIPQIDPSCVYFTVNNLSELKPLISNREKTAKLRSMKKTSDSSCVIFPPKVFRIMEEPLHEFLGHGGDILDISWSKDNGLVVGSMTGICRFYSLPGLKSTANYVSAHFTSDGRHIISACEDSNVYMWDSYGLESSSSLNAKNIKSCERFSVDASVSLPWSGLKYSNSENGHGMPPFPRDSSATETLPFSSSPASFNLSQEYFLESYPKGSATWPEEKLPRSSSSATTPLAMHKSQYKFMKTSCQSSAGSHAWGLVIVTAGWDGKIRSFHNYGLPVPV
ncbi:WD repeat-containing protein YMR102C [Linum perenne]